MFGKILKRPTLRYLHSTVVKGQNFDHIHNDMRFLGSNPTQPLAKVPVPSECVVSLGNSDETKDLLSGDNKTPLNVPHKVYRMYSLLSNEQFTALNTVFKQFIVNEQPDYSLGMIKLLYDWLFKIHSPKSIDSITKILILWSQWYQLLVDSRKFDEIPSNISPLQKLLERSNETLQAIEAIIAGSQLKKDQISQLLTSLMESSVSLKSSVSQDLWNLKIDNMFTMNTVDLTSIMKYYRHQKNWKAMIDIYEKNSELHDNNEQIFLVAKAYCKTEDNIIKLNSKIKLLITTLQLNREKDLDSTFQISKCESMMKDLLRKGRFNLVDKLYNKFLLSGLTPTNHILQSLFETSYRQNKLIDCFKKFDLFETYNIKPLNKTYQQMFVVHQELNNIDGSLKLLKKMTATCPEYVNELKFQPMLQICRKLNDFTIANETINVMEEQYNIKLTSITISLLMSIAMSCGKYDETIEIFNKYSSQLKHKKTLYAKLLLCYILKGDSINAAKLIEETNCIGIDGDPKFNELYLTYLIKIMNELDESIIFLNKLYVNGTATTNHFRIVMNKCYLERRYDKMIELYDKMIVPTSQKPNGIKIDSKILFYLLDAILHKCGNDYKLTTSFIHTVKDCISNIANGTLKLSQNTNLHCGVVTHIVLKLARRGQLNMARELINFYDSKFRDIDDKTFKIQDKLSYWRARCILYALMDKWDKFDKIFDIIFDKVRTYDNREFKLGTGEYQNKKKNKITKGMEEEGIYNSNKIGEIKPKLNNIFIGIIYHKLRRLKITQSPQQCYDLINYLHDNKYNIDNKSWDLAVNILLDHKETVEHGLEIIEKRLIWGYVKIARNRFHRKHCVLTNDQVALGNAKIQNDHRLTANGTPKLYCSTKTMYRAAYILNNMTRNTNKSPEEINRIETRYSKLLRQTRYLMRDRSTFEEMIDKLVVNRNDDIYVNRPKTIK